MDTQQDQGVIYVVATPIGNLSDISFRAIEILKQVDFIAAEDTRVSQVLLQHYAIKKPLVAIHDFNEEKQTSNIITRVQQGESLALISDAGTPLISDPGFHLIHSAKNQNIKVIPIPGASAAISALSVAGLPADHFIFEGFLPAKSTAKQKRLQELIDETRTMIFYESPHRIMETLHDMQKIFGDDREIVIAKELTKIHETIYGDKIKNIIVWMEQEKGRKKGEFVILVAGAIVKESEEKKVEIDIQELLEILVKELPLKQAVDIAVKISGMRKNELYQRALDMEKH